VHAASSSETGSYNLDLQFPTGRCAASTGCGQTKSGTLASAQQDAYSFTANAGEVVTFPSVQTNNGSLAACADLYASGKKIASNPCNGVNAPFPIATTGKYIIVAHAFNYSETGSYNLNLQFPTGRCATSLGCGQTKSGTLVTAQQDAYSFSAIAGQAVTLSSIETNNGSLAACADLYASGKKIASDPCNGISSPVIIPTNGKYTFVVHAFNYSETGSYDANWRFITGCPICSLSPASLTFATQLLATTSAPKSATLTNTGNATMSLTSIGITGTKPRGFLYPEQDVWHQPRGECQVHDQRELQAHCDGQANCCGIDRRQCESPVIGPDRHRHRGEAVAQCHSFPNSSGGHPKLS
jgi:hypothetical protein